MRLVREPGHLCQTLAFPRPSGRGSIAAPCRRASTRTPSASSPGHQAGAPLRHQRLRRRPTPAPIFPRPSGRGSIAACARCGACRRGCRLPPAIRPGLHCGVDPYLPGFERWRGLPPAIRPGLHCGGPRSVGVEDLPGFFPRPSGRGSIAATPSLMGCSAMRAAFPRPSGRGSIAAFQPSWSSRRGGQLPPAIRPGLHCGVVRVGGRV